VYLANDWTAPTITLDNCTITQCATYGIDRAAGTVAVRNCYSGAHTTDDYNGTMTRTTCAHSSATSFSGSTGSIAHSTDNFTNVTGGSEDYHLVPGASSTLLTGGTDLSGDFTLDIDGETRSDWSIGADELLTEDAVFNHAAAGRRAMWSGSVSAAVGRRLFG
jgi:hypothetical protein